MTIKNSSRDENSNDKSFNPKILNDSLENSLDDDSKQTIKENFDKSGSQASGFNINDDSLNDINDVGITKQKANQSTSSRNRSKSYERSLKELEKFKILSNENQFNKITLCIETNDKKYHDLINQGNFGSYSSVKNLEDSNTIENLLEAKKDRKQDENSNYFSKKNIENNY